MNIVFFDYECTVNNVGEDSVGKFPGTPFHPSNRTVVEGYKLSCNFYHATFYRLKPVFPSLDVFAEDELISMWGNDVEVLVGFNVRYDLHYLRKQYPKLWGKLCSREVKIWDCQYAEYLLSGQTKLWPSLNDVSLLYGGTIKDDKIKDYWDNGVKTEDIPKEQLIEYNKQDVLNTERIFYGQLEKAEKLQMIKFLSSRMDSLLATLEIEYNGMCIDTLGVRAARDRMEIEVGNLQKELEYDMRIILTGDEVEYNPSPDSHNDISKVLFGGNIKLKRQVNVMGEGNMPVIFKSGPRKGEIKTKQEEYEVYVDGFRLTPKEAWTTKKEGVYQVNEDVLKDLVANFDLSVPQEQFIKCLLNYRKLVKDYGTYYTGIYDLTWPDSTLLHGNINHCSTVTTRLSSSEPNLQNISGKTSEIKRYFWSRWVNTGLIVEADLSQIEIVAQAYLTQDEQLIEDLKNNIDFHCKRVAAKEGVSYEDAYRLCKIDQDPSWVQKRTAAKEFSFQRAYGAGALGISRSTGIPIDEVKKLIRAEELMYPTVVKVQEEWIKSVQKNSKPSKNKSHSGLPLDIGYMVGPNMARYVFKQSEWNGRATFKPTEIKNYVVQGTTADLLCLWLSDLYKRLRKYAPDILMINTVHDSVIFDVRDKKYLEVLAKEIEESISNISRAWEFWYGLEFNVPVSGSIKYGKNWKDQEEYK